MAAVAEIPDIDDATTTEGQTLLLQAALVVDPAQLGRAGQRLTAPPGPRRRRTAGPG